MAIRMLAAVAVGLICPLTAVATAQADANDNQFLAALKSEGITDHIEPGHAIAAGHAVCEELDEGKTANQVANDVLSGTAMPAYASGYFVGVSIKSFCPQDMSKVSSS